jgi:hypothetical protein
LLIMLTTPQHHLPPPSVVYVSFYSKAQLAQRGDPGGAK